MAEGWIKLHRKVQDCFIWSDKPYDKARAWIDLLLLAMHREKKLLIDGNVVIIERGSFLTSRVKLADRWGWSIKKVDVYLKMLENENMVTTVGTPKGTTITIVNYENYQLLGTTEDITKDTTKDTPKDISEDISEGTTEDIQKKNIKNYKNVKNEREYSAPAFDAERAWKDTLDKYPKKSAAVMAKQRWMEMLVNTPKPNRKDVAVLIFNAIKLYLLDYAKNNPDDKEFRYIPKLHTWFEQDCGYWITKAEEWQREASEDA